MPLDRGAERLLRMLAAVPGGPAVPPVEGRRTALRDLAAIADTPPDPDLARTPVEITAEGRTLAGRLYTPARHASAAIVYVHGGGWTAGDLDTHDAVCSALALGAGLRLLALDYRRPPEHPFPAAIEDTGAAVLWAAANLSDQVVLAGDSAGGAVAAAAAWRLACRGDSPVRRLVLLCPILEIAPTQPSREAFAEGYFLDPARMRADVEAWLGDAARGADPLASPLLIDDLSGFPPTRLHLAEYDPFRDEGVAFADRLRAAGVDASATVHAGMIHYFYALGRAIPAAGPILAGVGREIGAALTR